MNLNDLAKQGEEMTDDDKKLLTERLLGETVHGLYKWIMPISDGELYFANCKCGQKNLPSGFFESHLGLNRTFTTPDDFFAVFNALVEKGWWDEFEEYAFLLYPHSVWKKATENDGPSWTQWLLSKNPDDTWRIATLAAKWMERRRK